MKWLKLLPFPEYIKHNVLQLCRITNFDLFFSLLETMIWLYIILGVTISVMTHCCKRPCIGIEEVLLTAARSSSYLEIKFKSWVACICFQNSHARNNKVLAFCSPFTWKPPSTPVAENKIDKWFTLVLVSTT